MIELARGKLILWYPENQAIPMQYLDKAMNSLHDFAFWQQARSC